MRNPKKFITRNNRDAHYAPASWFLIDCMAVIFVLCYSAINAIAVEFASKVGLNYEILGYQLITYLCVLCVNIAALRAYRRGIRFSNLHKYFALFVVVFIFLSIQHDPEWITKDFLYLLFMVLPSAIILLGYINCMIYSQKFFITTNLLVLLIICAILIALIPNNISLRASLPHLNANTYATFGAYLMLGAVAYSKDKVENYALALLCALVAIAVLAYANSVGITLILFLVLAFTYIVKMRPKEKLFNALLLFFLIGAFFLIRFNSQNMSLIDRAETLVSNKSSTLYDRLFVYKYTAENFWNHFFIGAQYSLPDIHTAHNILIEIFLITGFFGVIIFCYFLFISSRRWLIALASGNQSLIFIALLYFFSFFESIFRGRVVYSVLLIAIMAASFDNYFVKFLPPKKERS